MCWSVFSLCRAHAHGDCCEAMHACICLVCSYAQGAFAARRCMRVPLVAHMNKAHGHSDCCEAMHACVGVCVWAWSRRMLTVIAARRCMRLWECVFGLE